MLRLPSQLQILYEQLILRDGNTELYQDQNVRVFAGHQSACLLFCSEASAGAIGKAQGDSFIRALTVLETMNLKRLTLLINSAGAHFDEPMEGLLALNTVLEILWRLRRNAVDLRVVCDGWLYGGMGMLVAAVAHEVILTPQASWGLLGCRVTGQKSVGSIPAHNVQPLHSLLKRLAEEALAAYVSGVN